MSMHRNFFIYHKQAEMYNKTYDIGPIIASVHDKNPVTGLTHIFYRYPARFSPSFARNAIESLTRPGDIVYDPFMGGGTTLVEAMYLSRKAIGTDLNSLAVFVSKAKTTVLSDNDIVAVRAWVKNAKSNLKLTRTLHRPIDWIDKGYQKNLSGRTNWQIRKSIELALADLSLLRKEKQRTFVRCLVLKTAQWAIDCRKNHPSANDFRNQLIAHSEEMIEGSLQLRWAHKQNDELHAKGSNLMPTCLNIPAEEIAQSENYPFSSPPRLILTSPPYPGVHVLYHRWQVKGRKETPAPYWIANCLDGNGASFYTFGGRNQKGLERYFDNMKKSYKSLSDISDKNTWLVQLVAFSSPDWQLPLFLKILQECGFDEVLHDTQGSIDGRTWRTVPNRKFYADGKGLTPSSKEVLLIHRRTIT